MATSGLRLYEKNPLLNYYEDKLNVHPNEQNTDVSLKPDLPEILFITSFPPRECGIATYTQDLVKALTKQFSGTFSCRICALESNSEQHKYAEQPDLILNTDNRDSFTEIADQINRNINIKAIVIQHEFGFYAQHESEFSVFFNSLQRPVLFVFHTVLPLPNQKLRAIVQDMESKASSIIVMTQNASQLLVDDYNIDRLKITVIPHGTHLVIPLSKTVLKEKYNFSNRKILSTFGLLSVNKGIEVTINALPAIIRIHPDVLFLIIGKTHPTVAKQEGEQYRNLLKEKVDLLGLNAHVRFVNEYLSLPVLLEYLQLTDIYLFTSTDPNQAVSGTFSYAISAGCPIISTPIPHAKELLSPETGFLFGFENSFQLANSAIQLLDNPVLRRNISLNALQKMAPTAWENTSIAHAKLFERLGTIGTKLKWELPIFQLDHIHRMTTDFGIIQFAKIAQADLQTGYTLDDNARALILMCQHYRCSGNIEDLILIQIYLQFIQFCLQENGRFLNYVDQNKNITLQNDSENLEDSNGRAIWAIGYVISLKDLLPGSIVSIAQSLFNRVLPTVHEMHSTRAMAFVIKGLYYQGDCENSSLITLLANRLVQMYRHERTDDWCWFESYLTYGNSVLPEALLFAYLSTNTPEYKLIAKEAFDFLISWIFVNGQIKVVSNKGWMQNHSIVTRQTGGEQPIDVAYTIITLEVFNRVFPESEYDEYAIIAFNWFLGENHLNQIIYNPCTGGCYDGLEEFNVNLNQGAESTVSYLMARLTMDRIRDFQIDNMTANVGLVSEITQNDVYNLNGVS